MKKEFDPEKYQAVKVAYLEALKRVRLTVKENPRRYTCGICMAAKEELLGHNLSNSEQSELIDLQYELHRSWSKYSGNENYPVPATIEFMDNECLDFECMDTLYDAADLIYEDTDIYCYFDSNTEYGQLRLELLEHMISTLEKELSEIA